MDEGLSSFANYSSILGHSNKPVARIISTKEAFPLLVANPLGTKEDVLTVTGLLIEYGLLFGYFGFILCGIVYTSIIMKYIRAFYLEDSLFTKIAIAFIIGTIIQTLIFSGYGWTTPCGLIITSILYIRANNLAMS